MGNFYSEFELYCSSFEDFLYKYMIFNQLNWNFIFKNSEIFIYRNFQNFEEMLLQNDIILYTLERLKGEDNYGRSRYYPISTEVS